MIESKYDALAVIFTVVIIDGGELLYSQIHEKDAIGIFPKKLGDKLESYLYI